MKLSTLPLDKTFYKKFDPLFDPFFFEGDIFQPKLKDGTQFLKETLDRMEKYSPTYFVRYLEKFAQIDLLLPYIGKDDVKIELYKNELTVSYECVTKESLPFAPKSFEKTFLIDSEKYDLDKISTYFERGVLSIYIHGIEKIEPKFEKKTIKIS